MLFDFAESTDVFSGNPRTISHFDLQTLKKATNSFHRANLLGKGGFGPVYRVLMLTKESGKLISITNTMNLKRLFDPL